MLPRPDKKKLRPVFRILVAASIGIGLFLGGSYLYLQSDPRGLVGSYLEDFAEKAGLQCSFDAVDVDIFPLPQLSLGNVRLSGRGLDISVAWATLRPSFAALFTGKFRPGRIALMRPRVSWNCTAPVTPENLARIARHDFSSAAESEDRSPLAALGPDCDLEITQGEVEISGVGQSGLTLLGLSCDLTFKAPMLFAGFARFSSLQFVESGAPGLRLAALELRGDGNLARPLAELPNLSLAFQASCPGILRSSSFNLDYQGTSAGASLEIKSAASLDMGQSGVPAALSGRITRLAAGNEIGDEIVFRGMEFALGRDSGSLDATLYLKKDWRLVGTLLAARVSLTEWLGFARNLMPGLANALDEITDASLEFSLDAKSLKVSRFAAECLGFRFTGTGGVADFAKPDVMIEAHSKFADLGKAIPEAVGIFPAAPVFDHPTLTPMPGTPLREGETGIDYDVRLSADVVKYGPLRIDDGQLRISEGKMDKNGLEDTVLSATGNLYGGSMSGQCILGGAKSLPMAYSLAAQNVDMAPIAKAMPFLPLSSGRFSAQADVMSQGKELEPFLNRLHGTISIKGANARLKGALQLKSLALGLKLKSGSFRNKSLGLEGDYALSAEDEAFSAGADISGRVWFGESGATFQGLPGKLRYKPKSGNFPEIRTEGEFSLKKDVFSAGKCQVSAPGLSASGNLSYDMAKTRAEGHLSLNFPDIAAAMRAFGASAANPPAFLKKPSLEADFAWQPGQVKLEKIRSRIMQTSITGSMTLRNKNGKSDCAFNLALDRLRLADFAPKNRETTKAAKSWNFDWLRQFQASGSLACGEVDAYDMKLTKLEAAFELRNARLDCKKLSARFCSANLNASGHVELARKLGLRGSVRVRAFSLAELARQRKMQTALTGLASVEANLAASLAPGGKLARAVNGSWSVEARDGSWQKLKNGKPDGKATKFKSMRATGIIRDGVLSSKNFALRGDGLNVDGGGSVDLSTDKLDCNFTVDMRGLPDFPLRLYGTIQDSKTSIGAGKMALNAIGGIFGGFANFLGGIFQGIFSIFR